MNIPLRTTMNIPLTDQQWISRSEQQWISHSLINNEYPTQNTSVQTQLCPRSRSPVMPNNFFQTIIHLKKLTQNLTWNETVNKCDNRKGERHLHNARSSAHSTPQREALHSATTWHGFVIQAVGWVRQSPYWWLSRCVRGPRVRQYRGSSAPPPATLPLSQLPPIPTLNDYPKIWMHEAQHRHTHVCARTLTARKSE